MVYRFLVILSLVLVINGCAKVSLNKKEQPNSKAGKLEYYKTQIFGERSDLAQHFRKKRDVGIKNCIARIIEMSLEIKSLDIGEENAKEIDEITSSMQAGLNDFEKIQNFRLIESNFDKNYSKLRKVYIKIKETVSAEKES